MAAQEGGDMQPREQYAARGPDEVGDVELVALLLGTGSGGRSALVIAADVLHHVGGLSGLARPVGDGGRAGRPGMWLASRCSTKRGGKNVSLLNEF